MLNTICETYRVVPWQSTQPENTTALNEDEEAKLQMYCNSVRRLNASQSEAVKSFVIRQLNREQSFGVELIQGPPGTGTDPDLSLSGP